MQEEMESEQQAERQTQNAFVGFDPAELSKQDAYQILLNCVSPRPIAFVSSLSAAGRPNLAPFSFFMAGGANPPSVAFSPSYNRNGDPKDTLVNIRETGEFVINVVTFDIRDRMNHASVEFPRGVSEWDEAGFTPAPTVKVRPARVAESALAMECRLFQIVEHGGAPLSANYVIGEVVYFHVAKRLLDSNGKINATQIDYIGRMSGDWYARANAEAMFALGRPPRIDKQA